MVTRVAGLFRRQQHEAEMSEELRAHLEALTQRNVAAGMSPEAARFAALRTFGGVEQIKERARDERRSAWGEHLLQDVRYALRQLRKAPGFALVIVLSLAFGIGASTATFGVLNEVLLKSLAVRSPEELVRFRWHAGPRGMTPADSYGFGEFGLSLPAFERFRADNATLSDIFAFGGVPAGYVMVDGAAENCSWRLVSGGFYSGLGVQAVLGRVITHADDQASAAPAAVISYRYWSQRFGRDPAVLGKTIVLRNLTATIVGVTPGDFMVGEPAADFYLPLAMLPQLVGARSPYLGPNAGWLAVMGRLRPGMTVQQAQANFERRFYETFLEAKALRPATLSPEEMEPRNLPRLELEPGHRGIAALRDNSMRSLQILAGITGVVLLLSCANVANLLVARGAARRPEIAVRLALGASRSRLVRQLMTENALLAFFGAVLGVLLASWGRDMLSALDPLGIGPTSWTALDARVLGFTASLAILTTLVFGLAPALRATRLDLNLEFKGGANVTGGSWRKLFRFGGALIVVQVALSFALLIAAGLLVRTLRNLHAVEVGFDRENLLVMRVAAPPGYSVAQSAAVAERMVENIQSAPGMRSATFSRLPVLTGAFNVRPVFMQGGEMSPTPPATRPMGAELMALIRNPPSVERFELPEGSVIHNGVAPNFFAAFGMPIVAGRSFTTRDDEHAPKVAVINRAMARRNFGDQNPVGRRLGWSWETAGEIEIVGVVGDARTVNFRRPAEPMIYLPFRQQHNPSAAFAIRTHGDPAALIPAVRQIARDTDAKFLVTRIQTQEQELEFTFARERLFARLAGFFGFVGVPLLCIGLYGLITFSVQRRRKEIGIRMALGASPDHIVWTVLQRFLFLVGCGIAMGVGLSAFGARLLATMLFGLSAIDLLTYATIAILLIATTTLVCWLPARRAAKVDPMVTLRAE